MDKKKILFILGIILIVILGIVAINLGKKTKEPESTDKLNENILKNTTVESLSITDQSVITRDGVSTYMCNITNSGTETKHIDNLFLVFTIDGEEIEALAVKDVDIKLVLDYICIANTWPLTIEINFHAVMFELERAPSLFTDIFNHFFIEVHALFVILISSVGFHRDMLWEMFLIHAFVTEAWANVIDTLITAAD